MDSVLVAVAAACLCPLHMCSLCVPSAQDTFPLTCGTHTETERERVCASVRELAAQLSGESVGREIVCRAAAARWAPVRLVW